MPHQRQSVFEQQFADRRLAADPAEQIGLPPFNERCVEQRLRIDLIAGPCARQKFGDDRIGLGKGKQDRVTDNGLAAVDELRNAAVAAREAAVPDGVDARFNITSKYFDKRGAC